MPRLTLIKVDECRNANPGTSQELHLTQELTQPYVLQETNLKVLRRLLSLAALAPTSGQAQSTGGSHCNEAGPIPSNTACLSEGQLAQHQTGTRRPCATNSSDPCSTGLIHRLFVLARSNDPAIRQGALCSLGQNVGSGMRQAALAMESSSQPSQQHPDRPTEQQVVTAAWPSLANTICLFLEIVSEALKPWQPWQVRAAAARSVQHSGQHFFVANHLFQSSSSPLVFSKPAKPCI